MTTSPGQTTEQTIPGSGLLQTRRQRRLISRGIRYFIALILIIFAVAPVLWVIGASLNPAKSLVGGTIWPKNASLINFDQLFNHPQYDFEGWLLNSFKVSGISTILTVLITISAGYALSRFRFKGKEHFQTAILIINVFPAILAMVALRSMFQQIGLFIEQIGLDSHGALILIYTSGAMGINVLMVKAFIDTIPLDIDESARVEGASHFQTFRYIIFPMIIPMTITVGVLTFMVSYADFIIARVIIQSMDKLTVMVGLNLFTTIRFDVDFGMLTAGAIIAAIPIILIYIPLQKYVIGGLTAGAVRA